MEKKKYSKPVVVAERFEPQEYCETCWYLDKDEAYLGLYHDENRTLLIGEGIYNSGEQVTTPEPNTDFPASGSFKVSQKTMPVDQNDGYYYKRIEYVAFGIYRYRERDRVTGPIYQYRDTETGVTYYFDNIHIDNNHS